jgi:hypothetical protein
LRSVQHSHQSPNGVGVHIYRRDGKFLARARYDGKFFGVTLGSDVKQASARLRHILAELENECFVPPTESRRRPLRNRTIPNSDLRGLCDAFLAEKRKLRGQSTASTYLSRLAPLLAFAEK